MESTNIKKGILIVSALAVAVAAVAFAAMRIFGSGDTAPPDRVTGVKVTKIDEKSLEVITLTEGEWMKLGQKNQRYKNPETGTYSMVSAVACPLCGELIPAPIYPRGMTSEERMEFERNRTCPKCGKKIGDLPAAR